MEDFLCTKSEISDLIPLSEWNKHFRYPSVNALRQYRFYGAKNGFDKVIRRVGKRIYISISALNEWITTERCE